ncbi:hypothetical protein Dimus_002863, partial [Dionaea muscipula]
GPPACIHQRASHQPAPLHAMKHTCSSWHLQHLMRAAVPCAHAASSNSAALQAWSRHACMKEVARLSMGGSQLLLDVHVRAASCLYPASGGTWRAATALGCEQQLWWAAAPSYEQQHWWAAARGGEQLAVSAGSSVP